MTEREREWKKKKKKKKERKRTLSSLLGGNEEIFFFFAAYAISVKIVIHSNTSDAHVWVINQLINRDSSMAVWRQETEANLAPTAANAHLSVAQKRWSRNVVALIVTRKSGSHRNQIHEPLANQPVAN